MSNKIYITSIFREIIFFYIRMSVRIFWYIGHPTSSRLFIPVSRLIFTVTAQSWSWTSDDVTRDCRSTSRVSRNLRTWQSVKSRVDELERSPFRGKEKTAQCVRVPVNRGDLALLRGFLVRAIQRERSAGKRCRVVLHFQCWFMPIIARVLSPKTITYWRRTANVKDVSERVRTSYGWAIHLTTIRVMRLKNRCVTIKPHFPPYFCQVWVRRLFLPRLFLSHSSTINTD